MNKNEEKSLDYMRAYKALEKKILESFEGGSYQIPGHPKGVNAGPKALNLLANDNNILFAKTPCTDKGYLTTCNPTAFAEKQINYMEQAAGHEKLDDLITALAMLSDSIDAMGYDADTAVYIMEHLLNSATPLKDVELYTTLLLKFDSANLRTVVMDYAIDEDKFDAKTTNDYERMASNKNAKSDCESPEDYYEKLKTVRKDFSDILDPVKFMEEYFSIAKEHDAKYACAKKILDVIEADDKLKNAVLESKAPSKTQLLFNIKRMENLINRAEDSLTLVTQLHDGKDNGTIPSVFRNCFIQGAQACNKRKYSTAMKDACRELFSDPKWVHAGFTDDIGEQSIAELFKTIARMHATEKEDDIKTNLKDKFTAVANIIDGQRQSPCMCIKM